MAQTITIFSPKGGVGRTFIATNLAVSLYQKLNYMKVILVDLDLEFPGADMARLLDLKPSKAIVELIPDWKKNRQLSWEEMSDFVLHHSAGGIDFLPVVLNLKQRPYLDAGFIASIIQELNKQYYFIVIDVGRAFTKLLLPVYENTNLILLVTNPDVLSVSQVKEAIDILESLSFPLKMIKIILNRSESLGAVAWSEVRAALPCEIIARIPSDGRAVGLALNRRNPLVLDNPRSRASLAINNLAQDLVSHPEFFIPHQELTQIFATTSLDKQGTFIEEEEIFTPASGSGETESALKGRVSHEDKIAQLKQRIHSRLLQELDLRRMDVVAADPSKMKDLRERVKRAISNALTDETGALISSGEERERLIKEITDEALGLGPLEDFIADPEITDIMVNNRSQIYIEKHGKIELSPKKFISNEQVRQIIERIVAPLGRRVDESVPMVDARLSDGSRVNAIIPPLSLTGPTLTIRKFGRERLTIGDLIKLYSLDDRMADFIKACVLLRKNIIVSGGTGSGKTTVLNVLSEFVPDGERIITIEDAAELKLHHQHWVRLESRPPNIEGKGSITVRDLFRNSLRMRPDRIIIGECRGAETMDMLQAMNTGHDGSMTTIHANSTQDVLSRLDSLILMSGIEIPLRAIREMIASAIDIIVHTARLSDGSRKVMQITEISGMLDELHIGLKDIFIFHQIAVNEQGKIQGDFQPTGTIPTFFEEFPKRGIPLSKDIFKR